MRPHFTPDELGIPVPAIQAKARAIADAAKPETWGPFEEQFLDAPFPELVARLGDSEERV